MRYKISIGADHRGFALKEAIRQSAQFGDLGITWIDEGTYTPDRTDYPLFSQKVVQSMQAETSDLGVLLCGSGAGAAIAANRFPGIYAAVVWNESVTRMTKEDDNVNVLVLPADFVDEALAIKLIIIWLSARFKGGRYQERLDMIDRK